MNDPGSARPRIVGGPVCTRTADRSLHVSFLPSEERTCSFDCVYCPFPKATGFRQWPRHGDIGSAVRQALYESPELESITISGAGEPTLHPRFGMALADVLSARATRPELPVRIVTNGTTVLDPEMRHLLSYADELVVRIDAGGEAVSRIRSGPSHAEIDAALRLLPDLSVESFFVDGDRGNTGERQVDEWIQCVAQLRPRCVYVTTVAGAPLEDGVRAADASTLERIAAELRSRTRLPTIVLP